jgi:hypothetical protein
MAKSVVEITGSDAQLEAVAAEVQDIASMNNGYARPGDVVDRARDPANVLHDHFEWDDTIASEKFRKAQARALLRRVSLHIVRQEAKTKNVTVRVVRAWQAARAGTGTDGYSPVVNVMADPTLRRQMVRVALRELRGLKRRFSEIAELATVWAAIDEVEELEE